MKQTLIAVIMSFTLLGCITGSKVVSPQSKSSEKANSQLNTLFPVISIREMLKNGEFEKLNATLSDYQAAFEKDISNEQSLIDAYWAFTLIDEIYELSLNEWINSQPDSYQPYLARAYYFYSRGTDSRGANWASETSEEQFEGMRKYYSKALQDIEKALEIKQDHIVPYYLLISIYGGTGSDSGVTAILKKGLEIFPYTFYVRDTYLWTITPRWGGTYEEMDKFVNEAQKYSDKNPRLKVLKGFIYYDAGNMQRLSDNYEEALELLNKALSFGELGLFYEERARIYQYLHKYDKALKDLNAAIVLRPQWADLYDSRARLLWNFQKRQEALKDIENAIQLEPNNEQFKNLKKLFNSELATSKTNIELKPGVNLLHEGWQLSVNAKFDSDANGSNFFTVRDGGSISQDISVHEVTKGYILLIAKATSERVNDNGSITGLPYLWGQVGIERNVEYLQGQQMLFEGRKDEWKTIWGLFQITIPVNKITYKMGQAERMNDPQNGSAAFFKDAGLYYFTDETAAKAFVDKLIN